MSRILVLTTDLPYFPGKMGLDHFLLRHLAREHEVGVVSPAYDWFPAAGVANLERFLRGAFFPPHPARPGPLPAAEERAGRLSPCVSRLPHRVRAWMFRARLGIHGWPRDALEKLLILSSCAPHLLEALSTSCWHCVLLVQSSLEPWLDYLPAPGAKVVYFHDVRADYLGRSLPLPGQPALSTREVDRIRRQEQRVAARADAIGFVSELDHQRACRMFRIGGAAGVAPITIDTDYYGPRPAGWPRDPRPVVLFTGHLSHPPNVDAVLYFLREVWPLVLARTPAAVFQVVGMMPAAVLEAAIREAPGAELHANVPDVRPFFWNAGVYVVPMRFGGGVRQKLLEAWSMRVPVVCTTMANEGTGAVHGVHCWLEDDPASLARRICGVLAGDGGGEAVLGAAQRLVEGKHSIPVAAPRFQSLIERAIHARRHGPFKVLHDLRWMELGRAGGMEQAAHELIAAISRLDHQNSYRVLAPRSTCCEWELPSQFRVRFHYSDPVERELETLGASLTNRLAESVGQPALLTPAMRSLAAYRELDFDLVHSLAGYIHADLIGFPGIVTVHDLQHLHHPQFFAPEERAERERLYREAVTRARHIVCVSEFTRQDVHRHYGIPLEKLSAIWNIPCRTAGQGLPHASCRSLLAGMDVTGPFLFYPAHCWPHKNHVRLVEAFERALPRLPSDVTLVLTGRPFGPDHPAAGLVREPGLAKRIRHVAYRSGLEMRALYQSCLGLVFPSLFEGFGMPVAEAIVAGKPVTCSNATSLPEIAGDAALFFDPESVDEIAASLVEIATRETLRASLTEACRKRRVVFSARCSALQTLAVYRRVHDEVHGS